MNSSPPKSIPSTVTSAAMQTGAFASSSREMTGASKVKPTQIVPTSMETVKLGEIGASGRPDW